VGTSAHLRFGPFEVRKCAREVYKHGAKVKLHGQPYQILEVLLDHAGEVVTREDIRQKLWPADTFVDFEHGLNTSIKKLRQALCDSATEPQYIETLPRLGYRFIAPVEIELESSPRQMTGAEAKAIPPAVEAGQSRNEIPKPHRSVRRYVKLAFAMPALAGIAVVLTAVGTRDSFYTFIRSRAAAPVALASAVPPRSLVVLPLQNLSGDPAQDYFADGMTDELTTDLAQFGSLRVISRTSAMHYKGANKTAPEIGRELGVNALIEGTVERAEDRVRIRVQLIDSASDRHLWARSYDRELRDVLRLQSTVAHDIAEEIQGKVMSPQLESASTREHVVRPEAYEDYLKGRYFWNKRTPEALARSIDYFGQAISKDPDFAAAYAGLADTYSVLGSDVLPAAVARSKARDAANKAVALDPTIAEGHTELALVEFYYDWNWKQSEREFQRAIELNPNYATAHQWYSYYLVAMGRFPEAFREARQAEQIDPLSLSINTTLVGRYRDLHQYSQALEQARRVLEMDPNFVPAHIAMGAVYEAQGDWPVAIEEYQKAAELSQGSTPALASLSYAYARSGNRAAAQASAERMQQLSKEHYVSSFDMATVYAGLGERDKALRCLEKAAGERESQLPFLDVTRRFDPLRTDQRFQDLLRRVDIPH